MGTKSKSSLICRCERRRSRTKGQEGKAEEPVEYSHLLVFNIFPVLLLLLQNSLGKLFLSFLREIVQKRKSEERERSTKVWQSKKNFHLAIFSLFFFFSML
jgi:flagellar biosynthesis protein FlhB